MPGARPCWRWRAARRSDDSPSLKGRGFYGFAPRLCRPTASRLASFNTREVACAAPASRTSTTSKTRSCCYPRERLTVERPNTMQLARCYQAVSPISSDARLRARRHSSPALKGRGLLPLKGKRRRKAVAQGAKKHQHVRRQRTDLHHKTALALVRQYDTIYHEAIQPANLSRRPTPVPDENGGYLHNGASRKAGLNKSIQDAGWGHFLSILTFKAACAGKRVEAVNPAFTTQDCSGCGERIQKSLSVRTHVCTNCGLVLDRDENAARNIQWRGQRLRGLAGMPAGMNREPVGL